MKIAMGLIVFSLIYFKAFSQEDFIKWNKNVKIGWTDFKGKADAKSPFSTMSAVGIYYKFNSLNVGGRYNIRFTIYAGFDKTKSWSKRNFHTKTILNHEQLHFDIAELVSRAFRKEAEETIYDRDYRNEINKIFSKYTNKLQRLQQKYDDQTMHSNNKEKQDEWEKLIHQELAR